MQCDFKFPGYIVEALNAALIVQNNSRISGSYRCAFISYYIQVIIIILRFFLEIVDLHIYAIYI